jgi:hypothetical protein
MAAFITCDLFFELCKFAFFKQIGVKVGLASTIICLALSPIFRLISDDIIP